MGYSFSDFYYKNKFLWNFSLVPFGKKKTYFCFETFFTAYRIKIY